MDAKPVNIDALTREFPCEAIKQREGGGRRKLNYYDGQTIIRRLNEATCNNWNLSIMRTWMEGDILLAHVCLTIPGLGSREHMGVQRIQPNGGEDMYKGAVTDALKKAATLFGVGLELYGPDYEADAEQRESSARESGRMATAPARTNGAPARATPAPPAAPNHRDELAAAKERWKNAYAEVSGIETPDPADRGRLLNALLGREAGSTAPVSAQDYDRATDAFLAAQEPADSLAIPAAGGDPSGELFGPDEGTAAHRRGQRQNAIAGGL